MKAIGLLVLLVAVGLSSDAAKLPDTFKKCRRRDDQNTCLAAAIEKALKAMKDGIPSLQLLPIDPLAVSQISLQEGGDSTNRALNENWSEFWGVIRPSMEVAFGNIFASVANVIFSRVQEKDIFTD
ncbi:hypothetical protein C0J52_10174 [Blattella germanica]|nr:hypothetical protein C0J52_10174 [Blattella germanica]